MSTSPITTPISAPATAKGKKPRKTQTVDLSNKFPPAQNADCSTLECGCNHWQACTPCIARATAQAAHQN